MTNWLGVLCALVTACSAIVVAYINKKDKMERDKREAAALRREKESRLSMEMMSATMELAYVTSLAVTGGHTNGNVEAAQRKAEKARTDYEDFLRDEAARAVATI